MNNFCSDLKLIFPQSDYAVLFIQLLKPLQLKYLGMSFKNWKCKLYLVWQILYVTEHILVVLNTVLLKLPSESTNATDERIQTSNFTTITVKATNILKVPWNLANGNHLAAMEKYLNLTVFEKIFENRVQLGKWEWFISALLNNISSKHVILTCTDNEKILNIIIIIIIKYPDDIYHIKTILKKILSRVRRATFQKESHGTRHSIPTIWF